MITVLCIKTLQLYGHSVCIKSLQLNDHSIKSLQLCGHSAHLSSAVLGGPAVVAVALGSERTPTKLPLPTPPSEMPRCLILHNRGCTALRSG